MAYSNSTSLAQNGTMAIPTPRRAAAIAVQTGPANHAGAAIQLQGRMKSGWDWTPIALHDPAEEDATVFTDTLTGPDQAGIAPSNALGWKYLQIIRTDGNGGVCLVSVGVVTSQD